MSTIPQSISGLQVWFDGADPLGTGTAPSNGATVSTWIDKSGNGYNATTASGKSAGTYTASNKSIYFPNSTSGYATTYPANPTAETMFVVFNNPSPSGNNNMVIGGQVGARSLGGGYSGSGGTGVVGVLNNEVAWLAATPANSYTAGATVLVTCNFTSTYNYIALNGGTFSTGGAPGFYSGTTTYLGLDMYSTSYYYIGYEMEILFYNSVLSTANQQKVEGYLAWKWGIQSSLPSGHPYKSAAPTTTPSGPIAIPANTSLLFVNTSSFSKTFTLPTISTNPGRLLIFKDIYGSFSTNPIFLSTTGLDGFENNGSTMKLDTNYGAWTFLNDAMTKWYLMDTYKNTMLVSSLAVSVASGGGSSLSVLPDVRYSFLSTNYSSGSVNNIGSASATYGAASISAGTYTSASPGYMTFTIGTGYIQAPSVTSIKTIIMIVRLTNTSTWSYLLDARGGLGSGWWASEIGPDWLNNSTYYKDSVQRAYVNGTSYQELNDNVWHHICLVYPTGFTDDVTFMARFSQNETTGGSCAEIMIFTTALTQQQINNNYNFFASRFGWTAV